MLSSMKGNPHFGGKETSDTFERFGYASTPVIPLNTRANWPARTAIAPVSPFALTSPGSSPSNLANRITTLMEDPSTGTANTRALFDAAGGKLADNKAPWTSAEREAQAIVNEARQMDVNSKLKLVSLLSGGNGSVASQLATQALQGNRPVGIGDLISNWRSQPNTEANRGLSDAMSILGTTLLSLQVVAPAGMVSPSLMNGALNTVASIML